MIFVSLGTHEQPFARAVDSAVRLAADEEVLVQHGHTPQMSTVENVEWHAFLSYGQVVAAIERASVVICHAGVGTIISALRARKRPVVIPRLSKFGEHVDDHQLQITSGFAEQGLVVPCYEDGELADSVREARCSAAVGFAGGDRLRRAVVQAARV